MGPQVRIGRSWLIGLLVPLALVLGACSVLFPGSTGASTTWTLRVLGVDDFRGVTYGDGLFVAVGKRGAIFTSWDGVNWTKRDSKTRTDLWGVTYGNGLFVAVGILGTILTSPDGMSWMRQASGTSNSLYGVTYGNGRFVAVGDNGTITILTSP